MKIARNIALFLSMCIGLIGFAIHSASAQAGHLRGHDVAHASASETDSFGQSGAAKNVTRTVVIRMTDAMRFEPGALTFRQGETVRLRVVNVGKLPHEFVFGTAREIAEHAEMMHSMPGMAHADANSIRVAPGGTADIVWKFSASGRFLYACLIRGHHEAGMQGTIAVTTSAQ